MSVKENLIAAKALISTRQGEEMNPLNAIRDSVAGEKPRIDAYFILKSALPPRHKHVMHWLSDERPSHADIMALFDRAIAACED